MWFKTEKAISRVVILEQWVTIQKRSTDWNDKFRRKFFQHCHQDWEQCVTIVKISPKELFQWRIIIYIFQKENILYFYNAVTFYLPRNNFHAFKYFCDPLHFISHEFWTKLPILFYRRKIWMKYGKGEREKKVLYFLR